MNKSTFFAQTWILVVSENVYLTMKVSKLQKSEFVKKSVSIVLRWALDMLNILYNNLGPVVQN